ncbi:MAG: replicative DNA helicase [Planctomycetes bacterium]|nr:replicative DNA helicase [Planctomycetota bacterium]
MRQLNQPTQTQQNRQESAQVPGGSGLVQSRSMPESLESEAAVLGSMILDRECIGLVVQKLGVSDFYRPEHQSIFDALVSLYEKNSDIDLVLLRDELKRHKKLKSVGGAEYLVTVAESVPSSASAEYYAEIVKDKSLLRQLVNVSNAIMNDAMDESGDVGEKLDEAEQKIFAVTEKKIAGVAVPLKSLLVEAFDNIEARKGHHVTGLPTSYYELDEQLCGLQKSEMIIVAGRPSMGKTSFAINIAEHIGADNNIPVAIFSLEMSKQQLVERVLCSRAKVDSQKVRKGLLSTDELMKLKEASGELFDKPIFIDDTPGLTPLTIRAKCRRLKSQHDIQCILIDYLQLMSLGGRVESRQQEVSTMSRYLKALARELEVPVMVLSQLNRGAEGREGHRPKMSDLRESGSIEQDADVVMLLHREDYYHRGEEDYTENNQADIIIAKQRNGPTGVIKLYFDGKYTRFENLSVTEDPF